ncbi:MAG: GHMP kinase [candidate division Zixibacteria bacterium]
MENNLYNRLLKAKENSSLPTVIAYNRIDGPGSSLDLWEFQHAFGSIPIIPKDFESNKAMIWTKILPRTIGITINTGTRIHAEPLESGRIGVQSIEYGTDVFGRQGEIIPVRENWLLKIIEHFNISGVKFVLHNLRPGIKSAGLGGSATATTGVCILANELACRPLSDIQIISMASRIEQEYGVSITGTQEQSNVIFGGITDYVWFPWGIPGHSESGYGISLRTKLLSAEDFPLLKKRMAIFHSGTTRASSNINSIWLKALLTNKGYSLHRSKIEIAYEFREAIRLKKWDEIALCIKRYQQIRTKLSPDYLNGAREIHGFAEKNNCVIFPLGAGGGGSVLVYGPNPNSLKKLRGEFNGVYREIDFEILEKGHELINLPLVEE